MENENQKVSHETETGESEVYSLRRLMIKRDIARRYRFQAKKNSKQAMVDSMERARLAEYAMYCERPWRLLGMNFLIGLSRGLGATIGLGLVLSFLILIAQEIISANLPGISQWVADLIKMVQSYSM